VGLTARHRLIAPLAAAVLTSALAGRVLSQGCEEGHEAPPVAAPERALAVPQALFQNVAVTMEVAKTDAERQKGLGGHAPLGETDGMLFVFEQSSFHAFWMKGMLFPLDLMWIENGQVVYVERNAPHFAPETPDRLLPVYAPLVPATYVLEVNAGFADKYGIGAGTTVELRGL
jgi:uncharacterized membrane protein (UPF0127 family)